VATLSTTSIAYASLRMEPTFMVIGQAAGTAAAMAVDEGVSVHDVDVQRLQTQLRADGQVLSQ
jgi:Flp pilus assembly secretin CpaC